MCQINSNPKIANKNKFSKFLYRKRIQEKKFNMAASALCLR